jgi:IrrE N-terminal-like domain
VTMGGELAPNAPIPDMTLITYQGRPVAMAGRERFYLVPRIAARPPGDPLKTWVVYLVLYARDVLTGHVPDIHYLPHRAELYAREALMPEREFRARAHHSDHRLATDFNVPLEQIARRRAELATPPSSRAGTRRRRRAPMTTS